MTDTDTTGQGRDRALADFQGSDKARAAAAALVDFLLDDIADFEAREGIRWGDHASEAQLRQVWKLSAERGFYSYLLPEELGGQGLSLADMLAVREAAILSGVSLAQHVMGDLSGPPRIGHMFKVASPHQVAHFLDPVCAADKAICFALTEADAGSDAGAIRTTAKRSGNGWKLNGTKRFISGGAYADLAIVLAVTDPEAGPRGISAFFVDLRAPGASRDSDYEVLTGRGDHADLTFEDVHVPPENLIGEEGRGFGLGMARINVNRLIHCSTIWGSARLALALSIERASGRRQFGKPIAAFQAIRHMLADMATETYAGRSMMYDAARRLEAGQDIRTQASICKLYAGEAGFRVADTAMQVHGGVGTLKGSPVEAIFRKLRMFRIVTGTSEIQRNTIAKGILPDGA
ncbi:acyl-CoA dehydrogenase (plasmid) [Sulfitobacter alexandrii]|uniref:Medium-chain specific acyl-CoA dehydrogenase, mitochondrial n=1 Tax=Sulfitobacter alexandrii TaxID=1917485 RepID=A0A1J0WNY6_9RHOB|nr:acyl-CoA dehydrogenase family protein [Sulfitobacter alexandrii]APE45902.1 acyl-CoA dehydrogenase [Sulfitobacter alexandrii]